MKGKERTGKAIKVKHDDPQQLKLYCGYPDVFWSQTDQGIQDLAVKNKKAGITLLLMVAKGPAKPPGFFA